jgi:hypothetical protein
MISLEVDGFGRLWGFGSSSGVSTSLVGGKTRVQEAAAMLSSFARRVRRHWWRRNLAMPVPFCLRAGGVGHGRTGLNEDSRAPVRVLVLIGGVMLVMGILNSVGLLAFPDLRQGVVIAACIGLIAFAGFFLGLAMVLGGVGRALVLDSRSGEVQVLEISEWCDHLLAAAPPEACTLKVRPIRVKWGRSGSWDGFAAVVEVDGNLMALAAQRTRDDLERCLEMLPDWVRRLRSGDGEQLVLYGNVRLRAGVSDQCGPDQGSSKWFLR